MPSNDSPNVFVGASVRSQQILRCLQRRREVEAAMGRNNFPISLQMIGDKDFKNEIDRKHNPRDAQKNIDQHYSQSN